MCGRALAKRELNRIKEFGRIALNSRDADKLIDDIEYAYNVTDDGGDNFDADEFGTR